MKKIFISFSSEDQLILEGFDDKILQLGLGLKPSQISCTGIEGSGIRGGDNFKEWIKSQIELCDVAILLISRNYKASEVCMNEMGALWALKKKIIPFILDPVGYENVGFIHNTTQLYKLTDKTDLLKFKDDYPDLFDSTDFSLQKYHRQVEAFLKLFESKPTSLSIDSRIPSKQNFDKYFGRFLIADVDHVELLHNAQPTLSDCRQIFTSSYADEMFLIFNHEFRQIIETRVIFVKDQVTPEKYVWETATKEDFNLNGRRHSVDISHALRPGQHCYTIRFLRKDEQRGMSTSMWCYINNRWVFFPKPWKQIQGLTELRDHKFWKRLIAICIFFGLDKTVKETKGGLETLLAFLMNEMRKSRER